VDRGDAVPAVAGGDVHDHAVDESGHVDERTGSAPPPVSGPSSCLWSVKRHERTGRGPVRS
jgi:hypothetical protein